ncbi:MAG: glycogen debranching protein [Calditrichaeota bacterium]|nr:glycogen debranching protein [Calditrichota bacterium]
MMVNKFSIEGYQKALELLHSCINNYGFLASTNNVDNYHRIWARDGCIIGLAALMSGEKQLVKTCKNTLITLAENQGPHGEIPSNVDVNSGRISYGGTAGRIDSSLWFIITCSQYWKNTGDNKFIERMTDTIEKVQFILGAWEYNNRGFLYVPLTGDWADEYLHTGYVLYDELLYLQTLRELISVYKHIDDKKNQAFLEKAERLQKLIRANYWLTENEKMPEMVYHEILYKKGLKAKHRCAEKYWAPFFSPAGYGYRFDTLANILVSLLHVANKEQVEKVDKYIIDNLVSDTNKLLPAFHPVITPRDEDWEELQLTFAYSFKNKPYEYHNGGLWPFVTGFYVADLAYRGKTEKARQHLDAIHRANKSSMQNKKWGFPEYLNGKTYEPEGTSRMGWSAAAAVIGEQAIMGKKIFLSDLD